MITGTGTSSAFFGPMLFSAWPTTPPSVLEPPAAAAVVSVVVESVFTGVPPALTIAAVMDARISV